MGLKRGDFLGLFPTQVFISKLLSLFTLSGYQISVDVKITREHRQARMGIENAGIQVRDVKKVPYCHASHGDEPNRIESPDAGLCVRWCRGFGRLCLGFFDHVSFLAAGTKVSSILIAHDSWQGK